MSRITLVLVSIFLLGLSTGKKGEKKMLQEINTTRILSIFFPTDDGRWTDRIVGSFTANMQKTGLDIEFFTASYTPGMSEKTLVKNAETINPDIIFLPDDQLYRKFSTALSKAIPKAKIVFSSFYTNLKDTNVLPEDKQMGVVATAPIDVLVRQAEKLIGKNIKSLGVIGGPLAPEIIAHIKYKAAKLGIKVESKICKTWGDYTLTVTEMEKSNDAVWPLAPFLVKMKDGSGVGMHQFEQAIDKINKPSFGYGAIKTNPMMSMNIKPELLGENAAALVFRNLKGENPGVEEFKRFSLVISKKAVKKMNIKVPQNLIGFLSD